MSYEINVSLNGAHYFATAPRSLPTESKMKHVYGKFKEVFKEEDGFKVEVSKHVEYYEAVSCITAQPSQWNEMSVDKD